MGCMRRGGGSDGAASGGGKAGDGGRGAGRPTYAGAMPLGNGRTTALAWANVSAGGVGIYLGSQDAMASSTDLLKLALLQVALAPNQTAVQ